jgi:hypothetical protein
LGSAHIEKKKTARRNKLFLLRLAVFFMLAYVVGITQLGRKTALDIFNPPSLA